MSGAAGDARRVAALEEALDLARGLGLVVAARGLRQRRGLRPAAAARLPPRRGRVHRRRDAGRRAGGLGRPLEPAVGPSASPHDPARCRCARLLATLLGVLGVLVAALFVVTTLQLRGANFQAEAENRRTESFLLADRCARAPTTSRNMVRLYVSTGDPRYRDYYDEILAIRGGTAPRPRDYDSSFWNRVLAEGKGFVSLRPARVADRPDARGATSRHRSSTPSTPRCAPRTTWRRSSAT